MSTTLEAPALTRTKTPVEPGIYPGISFDEYFGWSAVNASTLKRFSKTPAHVHHWLLNGGEDDATPSMDLGWLLHLAVLEPERFEAEVVVAPPISKRTNVGKAQWHEFEEKNHGKVLVREDEFGSVKAMARALHAHPKAGEFLRVQGLNELSIVWDDKDTGVRCKARIDRLAHLEEWPITGDFKSTKDASPHAWERDIAKYAYDLQGAHYLAGLEAHFPIQSGAPFRRFVHFIVESEPPYCVAVRELDERTLEEAGIKRRRYLRLWRSCTDSGVWPGYSPNIEPASLPRWAFETHEE